MDVDFRASYLAIGAAVHNMRIAASVRGVLGPLEIMPDGPGGPAAILRLGSGHDEDLAGTYPHMLRRVTNRNPGIPARPVSGTGLSALAVAAAAHGAGLAVATSGLGALAALLAGADRVRYLVPRLHQEMMGELRDPRTDDIERGIDLRTLEMGPAAAVLGIVRRGEVMAELASWDDAGHALSERVADLVTSCGALAAVTMDGFAPEDYLRAGQAMEAVWIAATAAGLAVQPIVPLFLFTRDDAELRAVAGPYAGQMIEGRRELRELLAIPDDSHPAMLLRVSHAPAPSAVSLRALETAALETAT
jgi:hypothetical protein